MKYSKLSAAVLLLLSPSSASLLKQKVQSLPALSRPNGLATLRQDAGDFVKQQGKCRRTADGGYNLATARYVPTGAARADDLCMQECEASAACVAAEQGVHCHTFSEGEMFSGDGDTTDDVQCYIKTRWAGGTEEEERKEDDADAVAALWAAQAEADAQALIDAQAAADAQALLDAEAALAADMHSGGWGGKETGFCVDTAWEDVNDGVEQLDSVDYRDEDENLCLAQCGALATATACEIIYEYDSMGCYVHTSHAVARGNGADNHACWLRDHSMDGAASHIEHDADHVDEEALLWAAVEDAEHRLALAEDEFQAITDMLQDELPADVAAEITAAQTEAHIRVAIAQTEKDDLLAMAEEYSAAQEADDEHHDADQDAHDAVLAEIWAGLEVAEAKLAAAHDEVVALDDMEHFLGSAMNEEQAAELAIAQAVAETDLAMARDEVDAILQMALEYEAMMAAEHEHDHEGEHEGEGEGEPEPTPFDYLLRDIGTLRYDLLHICDAMYVDPANTPFCDEAYTVLDAIEATTHVARDEPCPHHHEDHFHEDHFHEDDALAIADALAAQEAEDAAYAAQAEADLQALRDAEDQAFLDGTMNTDMDPDGHWELMDITETPGGVRGRPEWSNFGVQRGVCDDAPNSQYVGDHAAVLLCEVLGYPFEHARTEGSQSGPSEHYWFDDVNCDGAETMEQCDYRFGSDDCSSHETLYIICE